MQFYSVAIACFKLLIPLIKISHAVIEEFKKALFLAQLGRYGRNAQLYFPIYIEPKNLLYIGDNVSIAPFVQIWAFGGVHIGNNTMIGSHAVLTTATHDYHEYPMNRKRIDKPIVIGDNVWIGSGAIILPGITVASGSVVGAGSVITKDIPPNTVVAGVPGVVIKQK